MAWIQENLMMVLTMALIAWIVWGKVVKPKMAGVKSMSAADFKALKDKSYTLVDVRTVGEWKSGKAAGAIHIPLHEVKQRLNEVPKDKPVICICASGMRSLSAASAFGQAGYKPVYNFSGGMGSWMAANLPTKR
ncbi:MAG: rhodanese [Zetaproteobacteria bacterium CG2_30_46_52]|nr:MAG: rhodanese [Zetaproteobacteria bacterium CG2_30_46_52]